MSAWVKKRKIWVSSDRSWSVSFCAQSRQSSPKGTSSGIQWICCWRFQYSNAHGYSNGLYCLRASRRGISLLSNKSGENRRAESSGEDDDEEPDQPVCARVLELRQEPVREALERHSTTALDAVGARPHVPLGPKREIKADQSCRGERDEGHDIAHQSILRARTSMTRSR